MLKSNFSFQKNVIRIFVYPPTSNIPLGDTTIATIRTILIFVGNASLFCHIYNLLKGDVTQC